MRMFLVTCLGHFSHITWKSFSIVFKTVLWDTPGLTTFVVALTHSVNQPKGAHFFPFSLLESLATKARKGTRDIGNKKQQHGFGPIARQRDLATVAESHSLRPFPDLSHAKLREREEHVHCTWTKTGFVLTSSVQMFVFALSFCGCTNVMINKNVQKLKTSWISANLCPKCRERRPKEQLFSKWNETERISLAIQFH